MPRLSILVPHLGAVKPFEDTLASVLQNRPGGCQILVAHAGPYDDPWSLGDEVEFVEQPADATLIDLLNAGLNEVRAEVLHVVLGGTEATEGWSSAAIRHFCDRRVAAVAPLVVDSAHREQVVARGVQFGLGGSRQLVDAGRPVRGGTLPTNAILGPTLQAAFYRTDALLDIGGFEPRVGSPLVDLDVAATFSAIGLRCVHEPQSILLGTKCEHEPGSFRSGRQAERFFWRHHYRHGWLTALLVHPLLALVAALGDLPHPGACTQLAGRLAALPEWDRFRQFQHALKELEQVVSEELDDTPTTTSVPATAESTATKRRAA